MEAHKSNTKRQRYDTMKRAFQLNVLLIGIAAFGYPERTPTQIPAAASTEDTARLTRDIKKGVPDAIIEAGNSHNAVFINDLRAFQKSLGPKQFDVLRLVRISLAKLGDKDALQEMYCRAQSRYPLVKERAIENDLPEIGGWFSIRLLQRQFEEDETWKKAPAKYWKSVAPDVILVPLSKLALIVLPKLVKDPPLPSPSPLMTQTSSPLQQASIDTWKAWIRANSATLEKLQPTCEDVEMSAASCHSYRSKEKEWLAEITK